MDPEQGNAQTEEKLMGLLIGEDDYRLHTSRTETENSLGVLRVKEIEWFE